MTAEKELKRRLEQASAVIAAARQTLAEGTLVDLAGLEGEVNDVCGKITELPPEDGGTLKSSLVSLAGDLDLLTEELKAAHEKVAGEIEGTSARQQAAKAYARGQAKGT
ncbi:MAG: hypothetical protein V3U18_02245 [Alphaproteobacteria bacterium]